MSQTVTAKTAKTYDQLVAEALQHVPEIYPWDLKEALDEGRDMILLDIREKDTFDIAHIRNSWNVPRGLLEGACDYNFPETIPELVEARDRDIVVLCRSGRRSALAAQTMRLMGYRSVTSLKMGLRGWNDSDFEMVDANDQPVDGERADEILTPPVRPEQRGPTA